MHLDINIKVYLYEDMFLLCHNCVVYTLLLLFIIVYYSSRVCTVFWVIGPKSHVISTHGLAFRPILVISINSKLVIRGQESKNVLGKIVFTRLCTRLILSEIQCALKRYSLESSYFHLRITCSSDFRTFDQVIIDI